MRFHLAISATTNVPSASGVLAASSMPFWARRARTAGWRMISSSAPCSLATIGAGVPAGRNTAFHAIIS